MKQIKHTVKMLKSLPGCDDGVIYPVQYIEGETYEIGEDLMKCFVEVGAVELVEEKALDVPENKAVAYAPENKKKKGAK